MKPLQEPPVVVEGVPDFWERVRRAPHRLLALDYDGTLAPFRRSRHQALPLPGVRDVLKVIRDQGRTSLVIVSGRSARDAAELIGRDLRLEIVGVHGYERLHPDGRLDVFTPGPLQEEGLSLAFQWAAREGLTENLERKSAALALHTRSLENGRDLEARTLESWTPLANEHHLAVRHFDGGLELFARGRNKGTALANLHAQMPPGTLPVYLGDDATDEDAFRYLTSHGIGIKVGPDGDTAALGRVPDPAAVLSFLRYWPQAIAGEESVERRLHA